MTSKIGNQKFSSIANGVQVIDLDNFEITYNIRKEEQSVYNLSYYSNRVF